MLATVCNTPVPSVAPAATERSLSGVMGPGTPSWLYCTQVAPGKILATKMLVLFQSGLKRPLG